MKAKIKKVTKDKNLRGLDLIQILNPILMGWAHYFNKVVRGKTFQSIGNYIWLKLYKWRKRKHPNVGGSRFYDKYFKKVGGRKWKFCVTDRLGKTYYLYQIRKTPIVRHTLTKKGRNPYLPEFTEYFERRVRSISKSGVWSLKAKLAAKNSNFVCKVCGDK